MLLSIGMIVKNEEKYLDRCLSAIKPILDTIDSELIIADTGSSDKTVEIAKKHTDKVFEFTWVNDFAAARNSTLERASGEWFMFLDADEIFLSCSDLIAFFNTGEYRDFNSATYVIRSLYSGGESSDFDAQRLTRRLENTQFTGVVHEKLNTFGEPIRSLSDIVEHYGYLDEDGSKKEKKFERNSSLLLGKLSRQGDSDPLIFLQLYECFYLHDRIKAEKYLEQGIEVCEKREHPVLIALYCHKAHLLYFDNRFDDVLDVCKKYFGMSSQIRSERLSTDGEMLAFCASSLLALGRNKEAADTYKTYFTVYNDITSGRLHTQDANMLVYYLASPNNLSVTVYELLKACIAIQDAHCASGALDGIDLGKSVFPPEHSRAIVGMILRLLDICSDTHDTEILLRKFAVLGVRFKDSGNVRESELPEDIKAAVCMSEIIACRQKKQYKDCFASMKNIVALYPRTAHAISVYQKAVLEEYEADPGSSMTEMQRLAMSIKNNIRRFIDSGDLNAAKNTLEQYKQIMPSDPEIGDLLSMIDQKQ